MSTTESPAFQQAKRDVLDRFASSGVDAGGSPASTSVGVAANVAPEGAQTPVVSGDPATAPVPVTAPADAPTGRPEAAQSGSGALPAIFQGSPTAVIAQAQAVAKALASVIAQRKLYVEIHHKAYVYVEAWTLCGTMLGVFPVVEWSRRVEDGWEARVTARTLAGAIVGAAEGQCTSREAKWKDRDDYALRSMAQTRAVSKALRLPLGFVVQLAGYNATPAEEMDGSPA